MPESSSSQGPAERPASEEASRVRRRALLGVLGFAAASLLLHAVLVVEGFGEPDAARLGNDAVLWHFTGRLRVGGGTYRPYTSPLYIHLLKKSLDAGVPVAALPALINWANVVIGALMIPLVWLLSRRLAGERAALGMCALCLFAPAYWMAANYGMSHLPSFVFFLASLLLFAAGIDRRGRVFAAFLAAAALCLVLSCALKADIILCGGLSPGSCSGNGSSSCGTCCPRRRRARLRLR